MTQGTGWAVDDLDLRVARRLLALTDVEDDAALAAVALAAAAPRGGHVCVDLAAVDGPVLLAPHGPRAHDPAELLAAPPAPAAWVAALLGDGGTALARAPGEDRTTPVVVDGTRVYLDRYWSYEARLAAALSTRAADAADAADHVALRAVLDEVAPAQAPRPGDPATDRQRLAVANGVLRRLSVLSGGPGTGKTHTVVSLLAAHLLLAARRGEPPPRIALAAPTGKAAARLEEAVREALDQRSLPTEVVDQLGELDASTVHRLLGYRPDEPTRFRHDASAPLPHELVVVDEASMVALSLMAKLVDAVRPDATLVLVGDREQLASVEAGAVLGDVCGPRPSAGASSLRCSRAWAATLEEVTGEPVVRDAELRDGAGVWDAIVQLERFHRFGSDSGIGAVARAIRAVQDDPGPVLSLLRGERVEEGAALDAYDDVALLGPADGDGLPTEVRDAVVAAAGPYLEAVAAGDAAEALARLDDVRVLCAVRRGRLGVEGVRLQVERWLEEEHAGFRPTPASYVGRPVLVTTNDYDLDLMNGDVGVTLLDRGRHVVVFLRADGELKRVPATRLPPHETVWAMTIHKAQGSQFGHAVVVLPSVPSPVVTRELVYTGVTRARDRVTVVATDDAFADAVVRPVRRATGLGDRLWPDG